MNPETFIEWADRVHRRGVERYAGSVFRGCLVEPGAVWSIVLSAVWRANVGWWAFNDEDHASNWIWRQVRRACRWQMAKEAAFRASARTMGNRDWAVQWDTLQPGEESPEADRVRLCFEAMSPRRRQVLQAVVVEGRRVRDVAIEMGVKQPAVSTHMAQARDELRRRFEGTFKTRAERIREAYALKRKECA